MDFKKMIDEELEMELLSGNLSVFDEIYRRYYKFALSRALFLVKDASIAKDVVQETFLKLYNRVCNNKVVKSGSNKLSIKPLLSTMVHNESIDFFRRNKKMTFVSAEDNNHLESILFLCGEEQFDSSKMEINMKREEYKRVAQAVSCLPEEQQLLLKLRFECGLSFLEISELEGGSINTWLSRMRYALSNLRKSLNIKIKESEE